jgi:hypothetical protein
MRAHQTAVHLVVGWRHNAHRLMRRQPILINKFE